MKKTFIFAALMLCALFAKAADFSPSTDFLSKVEQMTHGFKLVRVEPVDELKAQAHVFQHVQSGAELLYLSCEDDNKVFSIIFRTPPKDDTGIAHILEHSVLCGSDKFPSKEPFVDLLKGSLNTFLNAMTGNDRTYYPVASRNDKDLLNLMNVYLDAVLFPNMRKTPEILMQEGWHYQIDPETGKLNYNGIVFNEMKGVYSSPQSMLYRRIEQTLFPDGTYGLDSGGNPDAIPQLTQKQFTDFHEQCYHPSNARIFLYGDGNIEEHLAFLDKEYLSRFNKIDVHTDIIKQAPFAKPKHADFEYSVNEGDSLADKTYFAANFVVGDGPNAELHHAMEMLSYILLDADGAPLRRALLDAGIGMDVSGMWDNSIVQPYFSIIVKNTNPDKKQAFLDTVDKTLRDLVKNGLDPKLVEAAINRTEFSLREYYVQRYPKGLVISMQMMSSWIYGEDPLMNIRYEPILAKIKAESGARYFEKLIEKYLLDNPFSSVLVMQPKEGLDKAENEKTEAKLEEIRKSLTEAQIAEIKAAQEKLVKRQSTPDSPEDVAKIPVLHRSDLERKAEELPRKEQKIAGATILSHDVLTSGIAYMTFYFDAETLPPELVPYASLLTNMLGRLDTENYKYADLSNEIDIHTGGIGTGLSGISSRDDLSVFYPKFTVGTKAMLPKVQKALELMQEIMYRTKFDDKARIKEILQEQRIGLEQGLMSAGNRFGRMRALSHLSPGHAYDEAISGFAYFKFLQDLENNYDVKADELAANFAKIVGIVFNRAGLIGSVTTPEADFEANKAKITAFVEKIPNAKQKTFKYPFDGKKVNEAVVLPSRVQYVCKSGDFRAAGGEYSGKMLTITNILRTGVLWNQIRVLGGAYGSGFAPERSGVLTFWSYRDPHLARTIDIFSSVPDYLKSLDLDETGMTKAIISSIGDLDKPLQPAEKGGRATTLYIMGMTQAEIQKERDEILNLTVEDIRAFGLILQKTLDKSVLCVFGGAEKIEAEKARFDVIHKLQP